MGQSTSLSLESDDDYLENEKIEQQQKRRSSNEQLLAIPVESTSSTITSTLPVNTEGRNTQKNEAPSGDAVNKHEETVPIRPDDDHKEEEKTQPAIIEIDTSQYAVNYAHLQVAIKECTDCIPTTEQHSASKLVAIFEKLEVSSSDCSLWQIGSKQSAKSGLQSVVTYTEQNAGCSPEAKTKLRVITKLIMDTENDKQSDYKHIFLLIASHGTVCNVMKEVAIAQAYGMMTNNLREYIESQSLQQQVLRVLRDYRVLLSEQLFHRFKFCNNTHYIAGWNNTIVAQIGVPVITDPNICYPSSTAYPNWKTNLDKMFLKTMYTTENILKHIAMQIDEKKIGYQKIVSFLEQHCPEHVDEDNERTMNAIHPFWRYFSQKLVSLNLNGLDSFLQREPHHFKAQHNTKYIQVLKELYCLELRFDTVSEIIAQTNGVRLRAITAYTPHVVNSSPKSVFTPSFLENEKHDTSVWWICSDYDDEQ